MAKTIKDFFSYHEIHEHDSTTQVMHGNTDNGQKYLVILEQPAGYDFQTLTLEHLNEQGDVEEEVFRDTSDAGFGDRELYKAAVKYHIDLFGNS